MNDQPNPSQFRPGLGAPPPGPTGPSRMLPWIRTAMTGGLIVAAGLYAAQLLLPYDLKPSVVAGRAAGDTVRAEIEGMKEARIDMDRRIADAQAQAKAQADVIAITKVADERTTSLAPVSIMAGLADAACIGAKIISSLTEPKGWGHQPGDDFYYAAQRTGAATCGLGNMRQEVTRSQLEAIRMAAAARGAPMTDGSVQMAAARPSPSDQPQPVAVLPALPHSLADVYAINMPSRHYPWPDVMKTREYIRTLPQPVQDKLFANLNEADGWDVLVDRTQAYMVVAALH